jgi:hypothetical protein
MYSFVRRFWPAFFSLAIIYAQADRASVTGVVKDPGGSVMPNVNITIRNIDTDGSRSVETNGEGYFTILELEPGNYELTAVKTGFNTYREDKITLETGNEFRAEIKMDVGTVSKTVTVTADAAMLNTENGMVTGQVVNNQEIADMPLNGRDFTELALYVPGVNMGVAGAAGSFAAINGARQDNTNFMVDGVDDRNVRGAAAQLRPNIDALQEFKMEVGGYSAEYGKMAGGILNMTLKSGSNSYHGTLFEYFRNDFFDAKGYFDTSRLPFHQNQFGGVISGPVTFPKVYKGHDRTFFMFSWESLRNPYSTTALGSVPTLLQDEGNFSKVVSNTGKPITIKNPYSTPVNAPFPGNIIPMSMMSPVALKIMPLYPLPNRTALGNNYLSTGAHINNFDSFISRGDHRFNDKDNLSVTYGKRFARTNAPFGESSLGLFDTFTHDDRSLGGLTYTHIFTPALLTEFHFGLSRTADYDTLLGSWPTAAQIGMSGSTTIPGLAGFPTINVTNYLALGYPNNEPINFYVTTYSIGQKFSWVKGDHVIRWGVDFARNRFNQPYFNNSRGTMTANGVWTGANTATNGDSIADLELGLLASSTIDQQTSHNYMRNSTYSLYVTDDWKVRHNLTLNLGLRYEVDTPPADLYGRSTNFIPSAGVIAVSNPANVPNFTQVVAAQGLQNLVVPGSTLGLPTALIYTFYKGFAPRVGFAWRPFANDRTVIRGGYGIFYSGTELNSIRNSLDNTFPIVLAQSFAHVAAAPNDLTLANPWNQALAKLAGTTTSAGFEVHAPVGYLQSYSLKIEREIGHAVVFEAGYVGSKGTHLGQEYNLNQPLYSIASYQATGTFPTAYPQLSTITYADFRANSIYNAGQFTLRKQSARGFFYRISYSYSKSIDDASQLNGSSKLGFAQALDIRNLGLDRARSDFDRGHVFQAVFSYPLPVGRAQKFLSNSNRWVNGMIGQWQLSGTMILQTGPPMTIEDGTFTVATGGSSRPNRIATGYDNSGTGRRGIDYPWYNPADFVAVPSCASRTNCSPDQYGFLPFADGNSGRGVLDAPGTQNINLTMLKNFRMSERKSFQFRWEVFNVFNHPNFILMNRNFNETSAGYLSSVADSGQGGPRIMQFALKYLF